MRLSTHLICSLLFLTTSQTFALSYLSYPVGAQDADCRNAYANYKRATLQQITNAISKECISRGGNRITQQEVVSPSGSSTEPFNEVFMCVASNPRDYTVFNCTYSLRKEP